MISVEHVSKRYLTRRGWRTALHNINFKMKKGEKIGILGCNGVGKSTLIRLISGVEPLTMSEIKRTISIPRPLAFSGAFQGDLTGMDNLYFICRTYNINIDCMKNFTEEFSELGQYLYEPVKHYSLGMRTCLAFTLSLAVEFNYYPADEVIAAGGSHFAGRCRHELFRKRKDRSIILVSHSHGVMKQYCNNAMVLEKGHTHQFEDMDKAYEYYNSLP